MSEFLSFTLHLLHLLRDILTRSKTRVFIYILNSKVFYEAVWSVPSLNNVKVTLLTRVELDMKVSGVLSWQLLAV